MQLKNGQTVPWYKVSWVWYIIFMKCAVITACIVTVVLIVKNPISMVSDDYYTEGRTINLELNRVAEAEARNLSFYLDIEGTNLTLSFRSGEPDDQSSLLVSFYHPTTHDYDFSLRMPRSGDDNYRQQLPREISGNWRVDIEPFDRAWRVSQNIRLPAAQTITLIPENYGI
ncbi:hypothetical protein CWE08_04145 [Aliidiomarina iranensis]|uniref:Nitrogen fixation protein FixH n=1 Tax=Aliidiomarina iranensis TaxID=1434071 RepID=A0A432W039_9GAMM|nr:FixH family protein [Aliidiomarina iranensis]RUO22379.1 hypothetical protein CWE08_04145 [Aliidiomarina iranensis]